MTEIKDAVEAIHKDFSELKKTHQEQLQLKADAKSVAEQEEKIAKLNKSIDENEQKIKAITAALQRTAGETEQKQKVEESKGLVRDAFKRWAVKGGQAKEDVWAEQLEKMIEQHPEAKALVSQDDTAGGFMVQPDFSGRVAKRVFETSPIRQFAAVQSIATDALEGLVDYDEASAGWTSEQGARTQTNTPIIGTWRVETHEQYAEPAISQKLIDDAMWDPESWLSTKVADKFSRVENAAFVNGTGVGQPRGFLTETTISDAANASATYDSYIKDRKLGYIPTGASGAFLAASTTNVQANPIMDAVYALKGVWRNMPGCAFAMHRTSIGSCRKLQDLYGNYLWSPGLGGAPSTLFGFPIAEFNDMPVIAANSLSIAFGNWREAYQIVDRIGIRVLRDPYTAKPNILFYATKRVGGRVVNHEALKLIKFSVS